MESTFTEDEISIAWEARKQRRLRQKYPNRSEYTTMLKTLINRGLYAIPKDRKQYPKEWRDSHADKIKLWAKRRNLRQAAVRRSRKTLDALNHATILELQLSLDRAKARVEHIKNKALYVAEAQLPQNTAHGAKCVNN